MRTKDVIMPGASEEAYSLIGPTLNWGQMKAVAEIKDRMDSGQLPIKIGIKYFDLSGRQITFIYEFRMDNGKFRCVFIDYNEGWEKLYNEVDKMEPMPSTGPISK